MRINDLKISTQLLTGNVLIIIMVSILAYFAYHQSKTIITNMEDLYNHPYHVGRATRDINANCAMIHSYMKNIVFEENLSIEKILEIDYEIENLEMLSYRLFDIIYERYLGERSHIDSARKAFTEWKALRDRLIYIRQHDLDTNILTIYREVNQPYVDRLFKTMNLMIDFEGNKAATFYSEAMKKNGDLLSRLMGLVIIISFIVLLINYYFVRRIYEPLRGLAAAADRYKSGNYETDYIYKSFNEFGLLSVAFQKMAEVFRKEISLKGRTAEIAFSMQEENALKPFAMNLLSKLMTSANCQVGAFYILNPQQKIFMHFCSIGMLFENYRSFSSEHPEGEFGMIMTNRKLQVINCIPDDTVFTYATVTGTFRPREIISVPVLDNNVVTAIISLASLKPFDPLFVQWLESILPMVNARVNSVMDSQKVRDYTELLDNRNRELGNKNKELSQQAEELREYNIELNVQKKQLDQMNYLKTTFLSNMSHELRTPLNSVIALASVLSRKLKGRISEDEYNYVGIIEKNGKELLALINDVLDLSRIESGKETISLTSFSAYELTDYIMNNLRPQIRDKDLVIINKIDKDLPLLISDRLKCSHILQNIIHNAIKFTEKGKVEISASVTDNSMMISISDTGIGIDPDKLTLIFDEFRQADERSSRKFGGTGLGLAIARKYCQMLGGRIEVKSQPGIGSVFSITLPLTPGNLKDYTIDTGGNSEVQGSEGISPAGRGTVMIIEDSEAAIVQVSDILTEAGYDIVIARNGDQAIEQISVSVPDAIVLDLMMPVTDGFEVLTRIRNLRTAMHIPVIILTAKHVTVDELSSLKKNNVLQLIQKGAVRKEELLNAVSKMFKKKQPMLKSDTQEKLKKGRASILIIEDNPDNMLGLKAILGESYELFEAIDGIQGIKSAKRIMPDLILLDISLPDMDGFAVLDELKKVKNLSMIPVIALTARALNEDRDRFIKYGFDGFIPKPVDVDKLNESIIKFLSITKNDQDSGN